jgi:hypothetical protein
MSLKLLSWGAFNKLLEFYYIKILFQQDSMLLESTRINLHGAEDGLKFWNIDL